MKYMICRKYPSVTADKDGCTVRAERGIDIIRMLDACALALEKYGLDMSGVKEALKTVKKKVGED